MPRGDRTGPLGQGPMTGRAAGYCVGNDAPGFVSAPVVGGGRGGGRGGGGRGWRNRFYATGLAGWQRNPAPYAGAPLPGAEEAEIGQLKSQLANFERSIAALRDRLSALESDDRSQ